MKRTFNWAEFDWTGFTDTELQALRQLHLAEGVGYIGNMWDSSSLIAIHTPSVQDVATISTVSKYFELVRADASRGRVGAGKKGYGWD